MFTIISPRDTKIEMEAGTEIDFTESGKRYTVKITEIVEEVL